MKPTAYLYLAGAMLAGAAVFGLLKSMTSTPLGSRPAAAHGRHEVQLPPRDRLRNGDLIFRSGTSQDSRLVRLFDRESVYSHIGLLDVRQATPYVVHIEPGSGDGDSLVRREMLETFLAPERASSFAVLHVIPPDDRRGVAALEAALRYQSQGVVFDKHYDLQTADEMYCSELVWRAYVEAGLDLVDGSFGRLGRLNGPVVWLSELARSRHLDVALASP